MLKFNYMNRHNLPVHITSNIMKRSISKLILIVTGVLLFASCSVRGNYMAFTDNVVYVEDFPEVYSMTDAQELSTGIVGALNFKIEDSLMIVGTMGDYPWKVLSLSDFSKIAELIRIGNGPGEFISAPFPSQAEFYREGGETYCYLSDMNKREMYRLNFSESLRKGQTEMETIGEMLPYPSMAMVYLGDSTYFYKTLVDNMTGYIRSMIVDGESSTPEWLTEINSVRVDPGKDFNLLSAMTGYNRSRNMVVEIPVMLNNINLYTLDGSFRKTVNLGKKMSDIGKLQELPMAAQPYSFGTSRLYDGFFASLYLGETAYTYELGRTQMPHIYCFDYEGNPLADILLDEQVTSFDFDFENGWLYVLDQITDRMWRYALPEGFDLR